MVWNIPSIIQKCDNFKTKRLIIDRYKLIGNNRGKRELLEIHTYEGKGPQNHAGLKCF